MRETASVLSEGQFDAITLGRTEGGRESELSRIFGQMFHNALRTVYPQDGGTVAINGEQLADGGAEGSGADRLKQREVPKVVRLEKHSADIAYAKRKAVRIVADIGCNAHGVPHCRIFAQKVPPDAGIRTLNAALTVMRTFKEYALATRQVLGEKSQTIADFLNSKMRIECDESSLNP